MKVLSILGICLLTSALFACSSRTEESTDAGIGTNTVPNTSSDQSNTVENDDPNAGDTSNEQNNTSANTNNTSPELEAMLGAIKRITSHSLIALNTAIKQGEILSPQQNTCLRTFDPAFGDSLLAIDCDQPLITNNVSIGVTRTAFIQTEVCQAGMANNDSSDCEVDFAQFDLPVQWTVSQSSSATQRPIPASGGATIKHKIGNNSLVIQNLPSALTGAFYCVIDLDTNQVQDSNGVSCPSLLTQFSNEINGLLNAASIGSAIVPTIGFGKSGHFIF